MISGCGVLPATQGAGCIAAMGVACAASRASCLRSPTDGLGIGGPLGNRWQMFTRRRHRELQCRGLSVLPVERRAVRGLILRPPACPMIVCCVSLSRAVCACVCVSRPLWRARGHKRPRLLLALLPFPPSVPLFRLKCVSWARTYWSRHHRRPRSAGAHYFCQTPSPLPHMVPPTRPERVPALHLPADTNKAGNHGSRSR